MTLARHPTEIVSFINDYTSSYRDLFGDVRNFDHFTHLHIGLISKHVVAIRHNHALWLSGCSASQKADDAYRFSGTR